MTKNLKPSNFDFIGDIHGHAYALKFILKKLDYQWSDNGYSHPEGRKVLFLGDYIDRGPNVKETLEIVKTMVDNENAIALMGNHEYNALCFHYTKEQGGGHLREHSIKNLFQHMKTIEDFQNEEKLFNEYLDWFLDLPLFYETEDFRAVHACWDYPSIEYLKKTLKDGKLSKELVYEAALKQNVDLHKAVEIVLKGKEVKLPEGVDFKDKDGYTRNEIRIKWWENPEGKTYEDLCLTCDWIDLRYPIPQEEYAKFGKPYQAEHKPVFFGHYWLKEYPQPMTDNVCCLDYSIALGGRLVAYRFDGEKKLTQENIQFADDDENENFLAELHDIVFNTDPLFNLTENLLCTSLKPQIKKDFIIISTGDNKLTHRENVVKYKELMSQLKEEKFSYTPLYGKFRSAKKAVYQYEKSIAIFSFDREGYDKDFEELEKLALEWTLQQNQAAYVHCTTGSTPEFVDRNGEVLCQLPNPIENLGLFLEDYFTKLLENKNDKRMRIKYLGTFIHPKPQSMSERIVRDYGGEWFISKYF